MELLPPERFHRLALASHPGMPEPVRESAVVAAAGMFATPKAFPNRASAFQYLQSVLQSGNPKLVDIVSTSFVLYSIEMVDLVDGQQPLAWMGEPYAGLGEMLLQILGATPSESLHLLLLSAPNITQSRATMSLVHSLLMAGGPMWAPGDVNEQLNHILRRVAVGEEWGDVPARLAMDARLRQITTAQTWLAPIARTKHPRPCTAKTWLVWGTEDTAPLLQKALAERGVSAHSLMNAMALLPDWETTRRLPHAAIERALAPFLTALFGPPNISSF